MIHTKYFTLLNYPKTGSTFLRNSVARTHRHVMGRRWSFLPKAFWPKFWYKEELKQHPTNNIIDQHGFRQTLNPNNKGVLITAIREPISWFTSSYKYQLWARSTNEWSKRFSNFPYLSPEEYNQFRQLSHDAEWSFTPNMTEGIGWQSQYFIRFYASTDLLQKLKKVSSIPELIEVVSADFAEIKFFKTESLTQEFGKFLHDLEYPMRLIKEIENAPEKNVSKNKLGLNAELSNSMKAKIKDQEYVLYTLRSKLGIDRDEF